MSFVLVLEAAFHPGWLFLDAAQNPGSGLHELDLCFEWKSYGGVSEINVACDIHTDDFGLQNWVLSGDYPSYRKGDLPMIRYGPSRAVE
jgi:hypothetical protein